LRTTLAQVGAVRQVVERGAREGRAKLDEVRQQRERSDAFAELGEIVFELIERGELGDLVDHPDIGPAVDAIARLDEEDDDREREARDDRGRRRPVAGRDFVVPARRARFDRGRRDARDDDDGTVSSSSWRPPARPAASRVWRPPAAAAEAPPPRKRAGGIRFDDETDSDDEDLRDYMHPDDVPKKES
jgi:hypothetical protein